MMTRILWIFLCLGLLSTGTGCYIAAPHDNRPYYERNRQPETYQPSPYEHKMDEEEQQYRIQRSEQERAQERRQQEWEQERERRQDPRWER